MISGEIYFKLRAFFQFAFQPDVPAMLLHDSLDIAQAEPESLEVVHISFRDAI